MYVTVFSLDSSYRRCRVWYGMVTILWAPCQLVHYCVRHTKCNWPSIFLLLGQKLIQFELSFNSNISEIFLLFQKNDFFTASRSLGSSQLCCDKPSLVKPSRPVAGLQRGLLPAYLCLPPHPPQPSPQGHPLLQQLLHLSVSPSASSPPWSPPLPPGTRKRFT